MYFSFIRVRVEVKRTDDQCVKTVRKNKSTKVEAKRKKKGREDVCLSVNSALLGKLQSIYNRYIHIINE